MGQPRTAGFALGTLIDGDEIVAYSTHREVEVVRKERMGRESLALKIGWAHAEALAALSGKGAACCPYCACLRPLLRDEDGNPAPGLVPEGSLIGEWHLPEQLRDGSFGLVGLGRGVRTHRDHLAMHLDRAASAAFQERQARKASRVVALPSSGDNHQAFATKAERRGRDTASRRSRREADRQRSQEMGCGRKKR